MTVPISYPGVYITEIPSGIRTIVGVATSITAFVGAASRGPADVPVTIFSFADFERTFGGLSRTSGLGYAVRDFYQNGGGEALIVRLVHMAVDKDGKVIEDDPSNAVTATLDVGVVEYTGHDGRPASRYFANIASAGMTGIAADRVNR